MSLSKHNFSRIPKKKSYIEKENQKLTCTNCNPKVSNVLQSLEDLRLPSQNPYLFDKMLDLSPQPLKDPVQPAQKL